MIAATPSTIEPLGLSDMRIVIASSVLWLSLVGCESDDERASVTPSSAIVSPLPPMKVRISTDACDAKNNTSPPYAMKITTLDLRDDTPLARAGLRIEGTQFRSETSLDGTYRWRQDALPTRSTILIACPNSHSFDINPAIAALVPYSIGRCENLTVRIDLSRCVRLPESVRTVRLRGIYVSGFEESGFYPCDGIPKEAYEHLWGEDSGIWVKTSELSVKDQAAVAFFGVFGSTRNTAASYADWSGTLHGPGIYGHLGESTYEFRPNEAHVISIMKPDDCEAPGFAKRMAPIR